MHTYKGLERYEFFKSKLNYNPETGEFTHKKNGKRAGYTTPAGYIRLSLYHEKTNRALFAHRLAWFISHGTIPDTINHINFIRNDNRLINLEDTTHRENCNHLHLPSSSKHRGVSWCKQKNRWRSTIFIEGERIHLGYFKDEETAASVYQQKLKELREE